MNIFRHFCIYLHSKHAHINLHFKVKKLAILCKYDFFQHNELILIVISILLYIQTLSQRYATLAKFMDQLNR